MLESADLPKGQARRRRRIIDEGYKLIASSGEENVQIRDIAGRAGVALGTAYRYFGSKERLVAEVYAKWIDGILRELSRHVDRGKSNTERMRILALRMFDVFTGEPQFIRIGRRDLRRTDNSSVTEVLTQCEQDVMAVFRGALHGVEARDADSISLIVGSVLTMCVDRYLAGEISFDEANREIAKAVRLVLEFRDPAIETARPPATRRQS